MHNKLGFAIVIGFIHIVVNKKEYIDISSSYLLASVLPAAALWNHLSGTELRPSLIFALTSIVQFINIAVLLYCIYFVFRTKLFLNIIIVLLLHRCILQRVEFAAFVTNGTLPTANRSHSVPSSGDTAYQVTYPTALYTVNSARVPFHLRCRFPENLTLKTIVPFLPEHFTLKTLFHHHW